MNTDVLLTALDLPASSRVDQRVPKKLLLENAAPTAADKRYINEGIEEMLWLAALKPTTIGVPEYRDDSREYLEIAVLRLTLRASAKATRLIELVHRAVPYPVLLLTEQAAWPGVSAAHKRWSQGEAGSTVMEGGMVSVEWESALDDEHWQAFRAALAIAQQPRGTLYALYQGWIDTLLALRAARLTGKFAIVGNSERATERRNALEEYERLHSEILRLRSLAAKERQLARQVEINLALKNVQASLLATRKSL